MEYAFTILLSNDNGGHLNAVAITITISFLCFFLDV